MYQLCPLLCSDAREHGGVGGVAQGTPLIDISQPLCGGVVGEACRERPAAHLFDLDICQAQKLSEIVLGHQGHAGDGGASTHELIVGGVLASSE